MSEDYAEEIPPAEELDYRTIAKIIRAHREKYYEEGDKMAYPGDWWHQQMGTLANRVETKAQLEVLDDRRY